MIQNVGILFMVKNEENSIKSSIDSIKNYFQTVIVLDTGSTDNTIEIIQQKCVANNQELYVKETEFRTFPVTRNESLEFANSITNIEFLLLMDAGDEFKTEKPVHEIQKLVDHIPREYNFGLVKQTLFFENNFEDHYNIRFVRNCKEYRYDIRYPVHERFRDIENVFNLDNIFYLYQDRNTHAQSTKQRFRKDIELLLHAEQNKRNLYYLGQSFMNVGDFENGFTYNLKCYETTEHEIDVDDRFTLVRLGYCAMKCNMSKEIVFKYLIKATKFEEPPIDAYIYILMYCIDNQIPHEALPFLKKLSGLQKPTKNKTLMNHNFYDYFRWHLISVVTLLCNRDLELGKYACVKAIQHSNRPDDLKNLNVFLRSAK